MKEIELTQGKFALVDDEDFEWLSKMSWHTSKTGNTFYAMCYTTRAKGAKRKHLLLHRVVMNITDPKIQVDHKDGNGLNNQRSNLRVATSSNNQHNKAIQKNNKSGYKGVCWIKSANVWRASIGFKGKQRRIGVYYCPIEAAKAYDEKARELHGEFARLNFPQ